MLSDRRTEWTVVPLETVPFGGILVASGDTSRFYRRYGGVCTGYRGYHDARSADEYPAVCDHCHTPFGNHDEKGIYEVPIFVAPTGERAPLVRHSAGTYVLHPETLELVPNPAGRFLYLETLWDRQVHGDRGSARLWLLGLTCALLLVLVMAASGPARAVARTWTSNPADHPARVRSDDERRPAGDSDIAVTAVPNTHW